MSFSGLPPLLRGELWLTFDILMGLAVGELILRLGLADRLMRRVLPYLRRFGIGPVLGTALTISLGSSRAGAALVAAALDEGRVSERTAQWGTLLLAFPGYLRRWPTTLALSVGMAGVAGGVFAAVLILRSAARFVMLLFLLGEGEGGDLRAQEEPGRTPRSLGLYRKLFKKSYSTEYLDFVCTDQEGKLIRPNFVTEHFDWLLTKYGPKHIRFHDLRHSCASLMVMNGVSMKQVQEWLGHSTFSTTADIYAHLDYKSKQGSAGVIANLLGESKLPK